MNYDANVAQKPSYVCPPVKIKKVTHKHLKKRRHGNSKEIQDNKQAYRLSDLAPCLFLFRVRISIQGTVINVRILHVFTGMDGKGKFLFSRIIIKKTGL
ncbi:hypothetical protein Barb4_02070 [Bacteroidales bacterium Barb4]|nr:hypothetical protein Barb4_02070 [Bacteroidales bacterium Barb4]